MADLHLLHSGAIDEGAFVNPGCSQIVFVPFFEFLMEVLLPFHENVMPFLFEFLEAENMNLERSFMSLLNNKILNGGVIALRILLWHIKYYLKQP